MGEKLRLEMDFEENEGKKNKGQRVRGREGRRGEQIRVGHVRW